MHDAALLSKQKQVLRFKITKQTKITQQSGNMSQQRVDLKRFMFITFHKKRTRQAQQLSALPNSKSSPEFRSTAKTPKPLFISASLQLLTEDPWDVGERDDPGEMAVILLVEQA